MCRFSLLAIIMSDNSTQFASKLVVDFCSQLGINQSFTSTNKVILKGLGRRLEEAKGRWAEELPKLLWLYHTTLHFTTQETPFRLTYGTNIIILTE
ncbi:hypothetical protein CR513_25113, partial [Mucuna pruriens]